jgi:hypothetical protein
MYRLAPCPLMLVFPHPRWQYTDNTKAIKPNRVPGLPSDSKDNLDCKSYDGTRGRN